MGPALGCVYKKSPLLFQDRKLYPENFATNILLIGLAFISL